MGLETMSEAISRLERAGYRGSFSPKMAAPAVRRVGDGIPPARSASTRSFDSRATVTRPTKQFSSHSTAGTVRQRDLRLGIRANYGGRGGSSGHCAAEAAEVQVVTALLDHRRDRLAE